MPLEPEALLNASLRDCLSSADGEVTFQEVYHTMPVVEHNLAVIEQADWIVDLGPDGAKNGGEIVFTGTPEKLLTAKGSLTGEYLRRHQSAPHVAW